MGEPILPSPPSVVRGRDGDPWWQVSWVFPPHSSRVSPDLCCPVAPAHGPGDLAGWLELAGGDAGVTGAGCTRAGSC